MLALLFSSTYAYRICFTRLSFFAELSSRLDLVDLCPFLTFWTVKLFGRGRKERAGEIETDIPLTDNTYFLCRIL